MLYHTQIYAWTDTLILIHFLSWKRLWHRSGKHKMHRNNNTNRNPNLNHNPDLNIDMYIGYVPFLWLLLKQFSCECTGAYLLALGRAVSLASPCYYTCTVPLSRAELTQWLNLNLVGFVRSIEHTSGYERTAGVKGQLARNDPKVICGTFMEHLSSITTIWWTQLLNLTFSCA